MATFSIKQNFKHVPVQEETQYKDFATALLNDLAAQKVATDAAVADLVAARAAIVGITAQLDADTGITDTDYAANNDPAALTSAATAALELTA